MTTIADGLKRPAKPGGRLRLCVPPDPRLGGYVRQAIVAFAASQGIAARNVADFLAAIGEAFANAVEHAGTSEPIEISAWVLDENRMFASVRDRGVGFSLPGRTAAATLPDAFAERGRGLPLMRRCTDVLSVRTSPGQGTRVTLGCYISRPVSRRARRSSAPARSLAR